MCHTDRACLTRRKAHTFSRSWGCGLALPPMCRWVAVPGVLLLLIMMMGDEDKDDGCLG